MSKQIFLLCLIAASMACVTPSTSFATEYILNPSIDSWLHEAAPDATRENDLISVWTPVAGDGWRDGLISFDVSGITEPIVSARLELYARDYWRHATAYRQNASLVSPDLTTGEITWNQFYAGYTTTPLETFGRYDIPADSPVNQFYSCAGASAGDIAALNTQMNATGTLSFALKAETWTETLTETNGRHEWADGVYIEPNSGTTMPPLMMINSTPLTADVDTWIREYNGNVYENDWVSVWHEDDPGLTGQRFGILEFDLSSITSPITSAQMSLFSITGNAHNAEAFEQEAFVLNIAPGIATADIDWTTYNSADVTETALESLAHYLLGRDTESGTYLDSDTASTADLATLEAIRQAGGKLVIAMKSVPQEVEYEIEVGGQRDWNDTGYTAANPETWARLIINETIPSPGDANRDGVVNELDAADLAANWLVQSDATWAMGDFNGDGKVNDIDATILATNWQTGAAASSSVPEPNCIALILCGLIAICAIRRNK